MQMASLDGDRSLPLDALSRPMRHEQRSQSDPLPSDTSDVSWAQSQEPLPQEPAWLNNGRQDVNVAKERQAP